MAKSGFFTTELPLDKHLRYKIAMLVLLVLSCFWGIRALYICLLLILAFERVYALIVFFKQKRPALRSAGLSASTKPNGQIWKVFVIWLAAFLICIPISLAPWGQKALVILSVLAYVLDTVFMHVGCLFHRIAMKNRCCATCRIYHFSYPMLITGLILIPDIAAWIVSGLSLLLFGLWEYEYARLGIRMSDTAALAKCRCGVYSSCSSCHYNKQNHLRWQKK